MSNPSDPERYSIDEMMDRLKSKSNGAEEDEGKLVIRADGSQAIKVRRRKRRTHQEKDAVRERRQKMRMFQITAVIILIMAVVIAVGFATVYVNGATFRHSVETKIEKSCGANADLAQFRMNPTSANAGSLSLEWPDGNMLKSVSVGGLNAKISPLSLLGASFMGQGLTAERGMLVLKTPRAGAEKRYYSYEGELPVQFGEYTVKDFRFQYENMDRVRLIDVTESEAVFIPPNQVKEPQLLLARGKVKIVGWPKFVLDRAHIEFSDGKTEIVNLRMRDEDGSSGMIEIRGILDPYSNEASVLDISAESYPLEGLIGSEFANLFSGRIDAVALNGASILAVQMGEKPQVAMSLQFRNGLASPFQLRDFPFLYGLSQTLSDDWFNQPAFMDDVSGKLKRVNREVIFEDLDISFKGRMALQGKVGMNANKQLSGELRVGVTPGMIQSADNEVLNQMFGPMDNGFRWMNVEISGTVGDPRDNFKQLYEETLNSAKSGSNTDAPSFEKLTRPK